MPRPKMKSDFLNNLTPDDFNLLSTNDLLNKFEEFVVDTATELGEREVKKRPDWFTESEDLLIELIGIRNNAFKKCLKSPSEENNVKPTPTAEKVFEKGDLFFC